MIEFQSLGQGAMALQAEGSRPAIKALQRGNVLTVQTGPQPSVVGVIRRSWIGCLVSKTEHVTRLVQGNREEIVLACPVDAKVIAAVKQHVACPGAAREVEGRGMRKVDRGRQGRHGDAAIAEAAVTLHGAGDPKRLAPIRHQADVDVGVDGPGLKRPQNLGLPGAGRGAGVE